MARRNQRSFLDEVPRLLAANEMSLRALGEEIKVSPSHLSRVLRRRDYQTPSGELARKVALAFGLPEDYFPEFRESVVLERVRGDAKLRDELYDRLTARRR